MGSQLNELNNLIKGERSAKPKDESGAGAKTPGLNQLSDAAEKIEVKPEAGANGHPTQAHVPPENTYAHMIQHPSHIMGAPSQGFSQEQLVDAPQHLQLQLPSQPDIPPPIIPDSQGGSQPLHGLTAEDAKHLLAGNVNLAAMGHEGGSALVNSFLASALNHHSMGPISVDLSMFPFSGIGGGLAGSEDVDPQLGSGGSRKSGGKKHTRRGPMDEMRQLVRIMVKLLPQSISLVGTNDEPGGGNRISEDQIKNYLERTLGEAPRPQWGVPNGWNGYLAELFSWATGKVVTGEECKRVAKREPGRSWEAVESELHALGVHPNSWPLPLSIQGIIDAEKNPTPIEIPSTAGAGGSGAVSKKEEGTEAKSASAGPGTTNKRSRASTMERDLNKMDEADVWKVITQAIGIAMTKNNTGADLQAVANAKLTAKQKMDEATGILPFMSFVGPGIDGSNFMNLLQTAGIPALDPTDPASAAAIASAMAAADPTVNHGNTNNTTNAVQEPGTTGNPAAKRLKTDGESGQEESGKGALGAQLGTLPMQLPPLNVSNLNMPYMQIPNLNLGLPFAMNADGSGAPGAAQPQPPGTNQAPPSANQHVT